MSEIETIKVDSIAGFQAACWEKLDRSQRWIFRGQQNHVWDLKTRFERSIVSLVSDRGPSSLKLENIMVREFKRHYHRYTSDTPDKDDNLEWLAVMQHYGAPTRLLDWSFSEYVALFFAMNDAHPADGRVAIWALNQKLCWDHFIKRLRMTPGYEEIVSALQEDDKNVRALNQILARDAVTMVAPLNPLRLSDRLSVQQGTFLVPLNSAMPFQKNLDESLASMNAGATTPGAVKITIPCDRKTLFDAFTVLYRVNLTERNLFPGIDGLARSMKLSALLTHLHPQSVEPG